MIFIEMLMILIMAILIVARLNGTLAFKEFPEITGNSILSLPRKIIEKTLIIFKIYLFGVVRKPCD